MCFWCGLPLPYKRLSTGDHLISKPLAARLNKGKLRNRRNWIVTSCQKCNEERGKISGVFRELVRIRSKLARRNHMPDAEMNKFWKLRARILPLIQKWRENLKRLPPEQAAVCVRELEELL